MSMFFRLCCLAPTILTDEVDFRRDFGIAIDLRPLGNPALVIGKRTRFARCFWRRGETFPAGS